jgi:pimeloyl-ACP methyl ester carboxylesterase
MSHSAARSGHVEREGLSLRYVEWGPASAPPVVMLHGLRSYAHTWEPVAQALLPHWRVIALDQRGRGGSDWDAQRRYHTASYVADLEALVDALGLARFVLVGHSMGGTNAIVYAAGHPERVSGLVIEDMGPGASMASGGTDRIKRELKATPASFTDWTEARSFWRRQRPHISEEALQSRLLYSLKAGEGGRIVWRHDAEGIAEARLNATPEQLVDLWPAVDALRMPTLLTRGGESDFLSEATATEMVQRNPLIQQVAVPGASHYVHDDQLNRFNAALTGWLAEHADKVLEQGVAP